MSEEFNAAITQPDRRCLFFAEETTGYGSEKVNEYDDMSVVVCDDTREAVVKPENALKKRAKVCRDHADYLVSEQGWEYANRQKKLVTDGGEDHDSGAYHKDSGPYSDSATRKALMIAGPNDTIHVEGHGEMEVYDRTEPYFGVELKLGNDEQNYRIVPAGFAKDPELWRVDSDEEDWIQGFELVGNVSLEVTDVGKSLRCPGCNEVLQNKNQRRMALIAGYCPHEGDVIADD